MIILAGVLAWAGQRLLFSTFMIYDDEGYVLLSLHNYHLDGQLYDQVFSQYGPGFFAVMDGLSRLGHFDWTSATARWVTWGMWLGTAAFPALLVGRTARSLTTGTLTFVATFAFMWVMIREPSHPGGLIGLLLALGAWLGSRRDPATHWPTAAALGGIGVILLLTKINVGVFFLTSAGGWLLAHALSGRARTIAVLATGLWMVLMPVLLMRRLAHEAWVPVFMLLAALTGVALWITVVRQASPSARPRNIAVMIAAACAVALSVLALTLARGTSLAWLWRGVILDPLEQTSVYTFAFDWLPGSIAFAAVTCLFAVTQDRLPAKIRSRVLVSVRLLGAILLGLSFLGGVGLSASALAMSFGPGLAVFCALSLPGIKPEDRSDRVRRWLAWLLAAQFLHGFPVAGSQVNWATFLLVPLVVLANLDSARLLRTNQATTRHRLRWAAVAGSLLCSGIISHKLVATARFQQASGERLNFPGTGAMVVTDEVAFAQQSIVATVGAQADMLFSLPGTYSLNLWSGVPTPTRANATQWFNSLSPERQEQIIARLAGANRPAVVVQLNVLQLLVDNGFSSAGPLADYLRNHFHPVYSVDGYALWARSDQSFTPLNLARHDGEFLNISLAELAAPVARLDWWLLHPAGSIPVDSVTPATGRLEMAPLNPDRSSNKAQGPWQTGWRQPPPPGPVQLRLRATPPDAPVGARWLLCLVDDQNRRLAAVRYLP
ncbi:hypothetical protein [Actomonas aquatica]|uniref:Glycosyltransferase RgtA/B/C/D-like domain-containing protein n=1 Tax=Actomonas aquatica TaxID=2866162 RepID=A0ABZ1CDQ0_9BACT|nr:hypothetical protein [Opitutus sp. WL0086]WRQ89551.1 hypothetical protein K1X11_009030 [Opitutus sp. WL0086]